MMIECDRLLVLATSLIEKGRQETTWTVLRRFGYNQQFELATVSHDIDKGSGKRVPSQRAVHFIQILFKRLDTHTQRNTSMPVPLGGCLFFTDPWTEAFEFPACLFIPNNESQRRHSLTCGHCTASWIRIHTPMH